MAILVDESSKVIIQGITGSVGRSFAERMVQHGTHLVAGVTPGKGGHYVQGVPVFNTVARAVSESACTHSLITVPSFAVLDAVMEAADAGIRLAVVYAEGVPVHDSMRAVTYARARGLMLCGPNSAGIASAGRANMSDLNDEYLLRGPVGIVSKSGTLTYEIILQLQHYGLGVSTVVCLGGDPIVGLGYTSVVEAFAADADTAAVALIGEIGGRAELDVLPMLSHMTKPLVAYVAGRYAPPEKKIGHAGAIISDARETADAKLVQLEAAGALCAKLLLEVGPMLARAISGRRGAMGSTSGP